MKPQIHPTAIVEEGVSIGEDTFVWDNVHVRAPTSIGRGCIVGEKTYIAGHVEIGDLVKVNAFVYVCSLVSIGNGAMISAGTIFTNDLFPRATTPDLTALRDSGLTSDTLPTRVREGATIGARSVIGCDLTIGRFSMVGMGSVVSRSVGDFHLVVGNPARPVGIVCRCGRPLLRFEAKASDPRIEPNCEWCGAGYSVVGTVVEELEGLANR